MLPARKQPRPVSHKGRDRPFQIGLGMKFAQQHLAKCFRITIKDAVMERLLRAKGRIDAGRCHAHRVNQVLDRGALIAALPEQPGCGIQHFGLVKGSGATA
jgi:hypothetical protein